MQFNMQQAISTWRSIWQIQRVLTIGVRDVGEFVEIGDGTWETHQLLLVETEGVLEVQVLVAQGLRDGWGAVQCPFERTPNG